MLAGSNPASQAYIKRKTVAAKTCGIESQVVNMDDNTSQEKLNCVIKHLNQDHNVNGILVQLPLPAHLSEFETCNQVDHAKDVDGFTAVNLGLFHQDKRGTDLPSDLVHDDHECHQRSSLLGVGLAPCTALAVKWMLQSLSMDFAGKTCVVLGRSHNVGQPIASFLGGDVNKGGLDMTIINCHRSTPADQLADFCRQADVLVSAVGIPALVHKGMLKDGVIAIDVGISRTTTEDGKVRLAGDLHPDVAEVASLMTPVPGGVGPCTVACLMFNTLVAASKQSIQDQA